MANFCNRNGLVMEGMPHTFSSVLSPFIVQWVHLCALRFNNISYVGILQLMRQDGQQPPGGKKSLYSTCIQAPKRCITANVIVHLVQHPLQFTKFKVTFMPSWMKKQQTWGKTNKLLSLCYWSRQFLLTRVLCSY